MREAPRVALLLRLLGHPFQQVDDSVRITPLIVVPGDDLHQVAVDDLGQLRIEDARRRVANDVR